jgi:hypothetical protein
MWVEWRMSVDLPFRSIIQGLVLGWLRSNLSRNQGGSYSPGPFQTDPVVLR